MRAPLFSPLPAIAFFPRVAGDEQISEKKSEATLCYSAGNVLLHPRGINLLFRTKKITFTFSWSFFF